MLSAIDPIPDSPAIEITLRVRYAETDALGVAHHPRYIVWLEQGRTELLRAHGPSYREIEAAGFFVVLSGLRAQYLVAARYDDLPCPADTGAPLLTARSEVIFVARAGGRSTRPPPVLLELLRGVQTP